MTKRRQRKYTQEGIVCKKSGNVINVIDIILWLIGYASSKHAPHLLLLPLPLPLLLLLLLSLHLTLVSLLGKAAATFACLLHFNQFQSVAFRISLLGFGFCVFAAAVAALRYARSSALLLCGVCFQFVYAKCDVSIIYF